MAPAWAGVGLTPRPSLEELSGVTGVVGTCVRTHLSKLSKLYTYKGSILLFVNYTRLFLKGKNTQKPRVSRKVLLPKAILNNPFYRFQMKVMDPRILWLTPVPGPGASCDWCLVLGSCRPSECRWHVATNGIRWNEVPVVRGLGVLPVPSTWWWSLNYKYSRQVATGRRVCKTQARNALAFQVPAIKLISR